MNTIYLQFSYNLNDVLTVKAFYNGHYIMILTYTLNYTLQDTGNEQAVVDKVYRLFPAHIVTHNI